MNEPEEVTVQAKRPVTPPPELRAIPTIGLKDIVIALGHGAYRNNSHALVDDLYFAQLRKMAKGSITLRL